MLVMFDGSQEQSSVGGDPRWLYHGRIYHVYAIAIESDGTVHVAVYEPNADRVVPYFYYLSCFVVVDSTIPDKYEFRVQENTDLHRVIIAPSFWAREPDFYEKIMDAHIDDTTGAIGLFKEHVKQVRATYSGDVMA